MLCRALGDLDPGDGPGAWATAPRAHPKNRGSGIFIEANAPLRLLQEGSYLTVTASPHGYANQSPTAGFGCIYA